MPCLDQEYLSVEKVRYRDHSLGNSGAVCQDDSKYSAKGDLQKEIPCKQQTKYIPSVGS